MICARINNNEAISYDYCSLEIWFNDDERVKQNEREREKERERESNREREREMV